MNAPELFPDPTVRSDADVSADGVYRYWLWRHWGTDTGAAGRQMTFVMLNPSTADADVDDPTIRRCIGFAKRQQCGSLAVVNLYPFRTSKPKTMVAAAEHGVDIEGGVEGRRAIADALRRIATHGDVLVAAWGSHKLARSSESAHRRMIDDAARHGAPVRCFGTTQDGSPRHPLYLPVDAPLTAWPSP